LVSEATGVEALKMFRHLAQKIDRAFFNYNPIRVYEAMTSTDEIAYCPFAYGYSNYSRRGYARKLLHFHDLVKIDGKNAARSTLGGTGLAVSAKCEHVKEVMEYVGYVASSDCQQTLFFSNGGQPGHLQAWKDEWVNSQCEQYFEATLPALQRAFLRPRYHGSMDFQDQAGEPVREYLMNGGSELALLAKLNELYKQSRSKIA
jgi:multiple sugar transport system substrate-binding protein